jgi:DUF1680 family protein
MERCRRFFWHTVTENRSVSIGGNSVSEHFNAINDFSGMIKSVEGPKPAIHNMLKLPKKFMQIRLNLLT